MPKLSHLIYFREVYFELTTNFSRRNLSGYINNSATVLVHIFDFITGSTPARAGALIFIHDTISTIKPGVSHY